MGYKEMALDAGYKGEEADQKEERRFEQRKLSDGRIKNTLTGEVSDPPDYKYIGDFPG